MSAGFGPSLSFLNKVQGSGWTQKKSRQEIEPSPALNERIQTM
jgi:hypothetical protein